MRKSVATVTALGIGAGSLYLLNRDRRARRKNSKTDSGNGKHPTPESQTVASQDPEQFDAVNILKRIRDAAFDSSNERLALALGRPTEEIETWTTGAGMIDGDVIMKARQLAVQRGVEI